MNKKVNVWKWEDNQWVFKSITPKIIIPESNILVGKQIEQLKVTEQNKSVYNSASETQHRNDLRYGKKENDPLSMELRTLAGDIPNHTDLQADPLTGECTGGNTTFTVANQIWNDKNIPVEKRKIAVKYSPYTFEGAPLDEILKVLVRLNTVGKRDEDSVAALYDRTIPIIITGIKKYGMYNHKTKEWKHYLQDFIDSYRKEVLSITKINMLWKVYLLPETQAKKHLLEDIKDFSWKDLKDALEKIERLSNKKLINSDRPDFLKIIREDSNLKLKIKKSFFESIKKIKKMFSYDMNGETIKINHPLYGLKKSSISTMMSHLFMFELCKVWNSLGIDMYHCTSEAAIDTKSEKEKVIPDLKFTYLTDQAQKINSNFEDVTQEVKFSMNDYPMSSTCLYYGGPGLKFMNPTFYWCATASDDLSKALLFFGELDKHDILSSNTFTLNSIIKRRLRRNGDNHFELVAGNLDYNKTKGTYKFDGEEVK